MSASREKKMRKTLEPKAAVKEPSAAKGMPKALKTVIGIVALLVVVALLGVSTIFSSTYFQRNTVALTVGEHEVTPADFNYFFTTLYNSVAQDNDSNAYMSMMMQFIVEETKLSITETYALYDAAVAAGYTLTEEETSSIDAEIAEIEDLAKAQKVSADKLVQNAYGKGCSLASYRQYREMITLGGRFQQDYMDQQDTSPETLAAYYAENVDSLDTVTYRLFTLPVAEGSTMDETKALAQTLLDDAAADETFMDDYELQYNGSSNGTTLKENITKVSAPKEVADWLFDPARVEGDTTYVEKSDASGLYLVRFGSYNDNDYNTANVRHILISVGEDADEAEKTAAKDKAQSILEEFQNGDKTEESFAELAKTYSEDNAEEGGLYENIVKGQMVAPFEEWCLDETRKAGDSGMVETDYGYHVMYFVGEGENYRDVLAKNKLLGELTDAWIAEMTEAYTITANDFAMRFTRAAQ